MDRAGGRMLTLLISVLPLGLVAGVSPLMFTQQTLLVLGRHGSRNGSWYAAGVATVAGAVIVAATVIGAGIPLLALPRLGALTDLLLGSAVVAVASHPRWWRRREVSAAAWRRFGPVSSYAYGLFSMATNFTTLPILVVVTKDVMLSGEPAAVRLPLLILLLVLSCLPALIPLLGLLVLGATARTSLHRASRFVQAHSMRLVMGFVGLVGALLAARGVVGIVGNWL